MHQRNYPNLNLWSGLGCVGLRKLLERDNLGDYLGMQGLIPYKLYG